MKEETVDALAKGRPEIHRLSIQTRGCRNRAASDIEQLLGEVTVFMKYQYVRERYVILYYVLNKLISMANRIVGNWIPR